MARTRRRWLSLLAGAVAVAALPLTARAITNGGDAVEGEQPFMVGILDSSTDDPAEAFFCGGSLITSTWVLTAGHCVFDIEASEIDVLVGATDLVNGEGQRVAVTDVVIHPDYQNEEDDLADVALLHLAVAQSTETIDLADDDAGEAPGTVLRLTGWGGITNDESPDYPIRLQQADMGVIPDSTCELDLGTFDEDLIVCAGAPSPVGTDSGVGSCYGDSGGPLFAIEPGGWLQVGVVSFGGDTCANSYSAYTSVAAMRPFIDDTVGGGDVAAGVTRVAGSDRFDTAAQLATERFDAGVTAAYIVTGATFPDALAAAPAAAVDGGPILLTARDALPAAMVVALQALAPASIVVVGGAGAVSGAVVAQLGSLTTGAVSRVAGPSRYETAVELSQLAFPTGADAIYLASGVGFADALSGAAAAAALPSSPLLLTTSTELPIATEDEIVRIDPEIVFVLGGPGAIADDVVRAIEALGFGVERVAGADRYATSVLISSQWDGADEVVVATGATFPDGLVAGALGLPLLLVPPGALSPATADALTALGPSSVLVLGGTSAVSDGVLALLESLL